MRRTYWDNTLLPAGNSWDRFRPQDVIAFSVYCKPFPHCADGPTAPPSRPAPIRCFHPLSVQASGGRPLPVQAFSPRKSACRDKEGKDGKNACVSARFPPTLHSIQVIRRVILSDTPEDVQAPLPFLQEIPDLSPITGSRPQHSPMFPG